MTPEQKEPNTKTVKTMDKQLLEQESKEKYPPTFETLGIRYDNPTHLALQKAYISGATSSSTVKELEREVERLKGVCQEFKQVKAFLIKGSPLKNLMEEIISKHNL